ncbi:MAG: hypothetical protein HC857_07900 [Synechococcales cyanobacterium RU_4_20]|nr:hypothetical protein [Synechococcales cyanobacterium RU_4_20]
MKVALGDRSTLSGLLIPPIPTSPSTARFAFTIFLAGMLTVGTFTLGILSSSLTLGAMAQTRKPAASKSPPSQTLQLSNQQLLALAEALRLKASEGPGFAQEVYYGDWQVKGSSIPAWSKGCLGRSITPGQFADSPETARSVVLCVLKDEFQKALTKTQGNPAIAAQHVAAWWRTGDSERYREGAIRPFAQQVAKLYQQQLATVAPGSPVKLPATDTPYDRYMSTGYQFSREGQYAGAVIYFERALDERPKDSFASNALRDVSRKAKTTAETDVNTQKMAQETSAALTSEHWVEVAKNAAGDRTLVAPSSLVSNEEGATVAYWEYRAFRGENRAFSPVPKSQPIRSALLYRVTDCSAKNTQTRVMKLYTDKREEIHQENFGSAGPVEIPELGSSSAKVVEYACRRVGGAVETDNELIQPIKSR